MVLLARPLMSPRVWVPCDALSEARAGPVTSRSLEMALTAIGAELPYYRRLVALSAVAQTSAITSDARLLPGADNPWGCCGDGTSLDVGFGMLPIRRPPRREEGAIEASEAIDAGLRCVRLNGQPVETTTKYQW